MPHMTRIDNKQQAPSTSQLVLTHSNGCSAVLIIKGTTASKKAQGICSSLRLGCLLSQIAVQQLCIHSNLCMHTAAKAHPMPLWMPGCKMTWSPSLAACTAAFRDLKLVRWGEPAPHDMHMSLKWPQMT